MTDEEIAASFPFLTVEELTDDVRMMKRKPEIYDSQGNKVFVWGYNDCGQLGSTPSEAKVSDTVSELVLLIMRGCR